MKKKDYLPKVSPLTRAIITKYGWRVLRNVSLGNPLRVEFSLMVYTAHRDEFNQRYPGQLPGDQFNAAVLDTVIDVQRNS